MAGIPLNDRCLDILIQKLDDDGSGEIEFSEMMQAQMIHKRQKAKMMMEVATAQTEVEKTEVGRVRSKLNKLMAKHMEGNPAFKRRVDDFKQLMNSSKRDDVLRAAFEKKLAIRKEFKIERAKALEIRRAKEEAIALIVEADNQEIEAKLIDGENTNNSALEQETLSENIPNETSDSKGGTPV